MSARERRVGEERLVITQVLTTFIVFRWIVCFTGLGQQREGQWQQCHEPPDSFSIHALLYRLLPGNAFLEIVPELLELLNAHQSHFELAVGDRKRLTA